MPPSEREYSSELKIISSIYRTQNLQIKTRLMYSYLNLDRRCILLVINIFQSFDLSQINSIPNNFPVKPEFQRKHTHIVIDIKLLKFILLQMNLQDQR